MGCLWRVKRLIFCLRYSSAAYNVIILERVIPEPYCDCLAMGP